MKIAVLGGSFDPPHKGHALIAKRLLKLYSFNQVWLMPCYQHPFNKTISSPEKRLTMVKYLENDKIKVSDLEITRKTINYTIDTLRQLIKTHPQDKFSWIIGTDQVKDFTKWKKWREIINNFQLIIVPRTEYGKAKMELKNIIKQITLPKNILLINKIKFPPIYVSSRLVRQNIQERKPISGLVPKKIEKYIIKNGLYR